MLYGEENHGYKNATRRVAGKKIKGRGGKKIKSDSRIYTPANGLKFVIDVLCGVVRGSE